MLRTSHFNVRASREELARWKLQAEAAGVSLSELVRSRLEDHAPVAVPPESQEEDWWVTLERLANS